MRAGPRRPSSQSSNKGDSISKAATSSVERLPKTKKLEQKPPSRSSSQGGADLMVEVGEDEFNDLKTSFLLEVPGEDEEPDMDTYGHETEELVPIKAKHGGLFGADLSRVKF